MNTAILKAIKALVLVTTVMPATAFAEPAITARHMLALAQHQSQSQVVEAVLDRFSSRAFGHSIPEPVKAAAQSSSFVATGDPLPMTQPSTSQVAEPSVETAQLNVAALPASNFEVPAAESSPSHSTLVASLHATTNKAEMEVQLAPSSLPNSIPGSVATHATPTPVALPGGDMVGPAQPTQPSAPISTTAPAKLTKDSTHNPPARQRRHAGRALAHVGSGQITSRNERIGVHIAGQLRRIMDQPGVKSIIAQYGLN